MSTLRLSPLQASASDYNLGYSICPSGATPYTGSLEQLAQDLDLPGNHLAARPADRVALLDRALKVEDVGKDVLAEFRRQLLVLLEREVGQAGLERLSQGDGPARDVVRLAERNLRGTAACQCGNTDMIAG